MKPEQNKAKCCSRRQKIIGALALAGLFACGLMIGWTVNNKNKNTQNNESVCEQIETALLEKLNPQDSTNWVHHEQNAKIYHRLSEIGCEVNRDKYHDLALLEETLQNTTNYRTEEKKQTNDISTCEQIEELLNREIGPQDDLDSQTHIYNAKIYANLSERGCPENSAHYVELAKRELEIARALEDDEMTQRDTIEVVETYKRIQMQNAAQEILDKAKKITDPAIDFIIQLEKIINE